MGLQARGATYPSVCALSQHPVIAVSILANLNVCDIKWDARPQLRLQCIAGTMYLCSRNGALLMRCQTPERVVVCLQVTAMRRSIVHLHVNVLYLAA